MWLCLNDSFLSVVEDYSSTTTPRELLVRARLVGNIEAMFPDAEVREDEGSDYRFRATIPREEVAKALSDRVMEIDYTNFKDSTESKPLHDAYLRIWETLYQLQERMR